MTAPAPAWSDEFDGPQGAPPDPRSWRHETGAGGWGNDELQTYTADPANAFLDGAGCLVIRARKDGPRFSSARLITKGLVHFTYGRIECRACLPAGDGLWSAFWTLGADIDDAPWPACGEIDVMENLGSDSGRVFGTVHCPGYSGPEGVSGDTTGHELHGRFHVYATDWRPSSITWLLDDIPYHEVRRTDLRTAWLFDHPFYILLNLAVGGTLGGKVGDATAFPADLKVDYVRLYNAGNLAITDGAAK